VTTERQRLGEKEVFEVTSIEHKHLVIQDIKWPGRSRHGFLEISTTSFAPNQAFVVLTKAGEPFSYGSARVIAVAVAVTMLLLGITEELLPTKTQPTILLEVASPLGDLQYTE